MFLESGNNFDSNDNDNFVEFPIKDDEIEFEITDDEDSEASVATVKLMNHRIVLMIWMTIQIGTIQRLGHQTIHQFGAIQRDDRDNYNWTLVYVF